jgi:hypothetical protein
MGNGKQNVSKFFTSQNLNFVIFERLMIFSSAYSFAFEMTILSSITFLKEQSCYFYTYKLFFVYV